MRTPQLLHAHVLQAQGALQSVTQQRLRPMQRRPNHARLPRRRPPMPQIQESALSKRRSKHSGEPLGIAICNASHMPLWLSAHARCRHAPVMHARCVRLLSHSRSHNQQPAGHQLLLHRLTRNSMRLALIRIHPAAAAAAAAMAQSCAIAATSCCICT